MITKENNKNNTRNNLEFNNINGNSTAPDTLEHSWEILFVNSELFEPRWKTQGLDKYDSNRRFERLFPTVIENLVEARKTVIEIKVEINKKNKIKNPELKINSSLLLNSK